MAILALPEGPLHLAALTFKIVLSTLTLKYDHLVLTT